MKNKYLVFTYDNYYPAGGWNDLEDVFETLDEAVAFAKSKVTAPEPPEEKPDLYTYPDADFAQVVDLETMSRIKFKAI